MATSNDIVLWPQGTPGLASASPEFVPTLTPYLVKSGKATGAVIICPGGGYGGRAPHEGGPIAEMLNAAGIAAFVVNYRVSPYRNPYPQLDARRAIKLVRANAAEYNVLPDKIGILGFSAGGHLASTVATHPELPPAVDDAIERQSSRPDAAILCYAVLTFGEFGHGGSAKNLLGDNLNEATRAEFSSHLRVTPETPPCFLWHTAEDPGVPVENSLLFASALSRCKVPFALHVFPKGRHGLGLAVDDPVVSQWAGLCTNWLKSLNF